jgi:hypothetical protein
MFDVARGARVTVAAEPGDRDTVRELGSLVGCLRGTSLAELPDARVEEDFLELNRSMEQLEVERLRRLAEIDRRRLFERDGHLSAAAWLVSRAKLAWGTAREQVRIARGLERMDRTRTALEAGELSMSSVRVLTSARAFDPVAFERAEPELVDAARLHSVHDLHRVAAFWRDATERGDAVPGNDPFRRRRRLHVSATLGGMVRVDGDLDPLTGETLLTALHAVMDAEARSGDADGRTPPQRRADALGEVCRQWLDLEERPRIAGERPHVTVTVSAEGLRRHATTRAELDHTGPVDGDTARRLACDASLMRVVMGPRSEPLDVGRRTAVVPPGLRRAVVVRDRHCRFPGCDRPHRWCDAHHTRHWADGGPTALENLVLLCRRHHGWVHRTGGFTLDLVDGRPLFRRPDGSALEDRAPPVPRDRDEERASRSPCDGTVVEWTR